jgi:predicted Rossmann fold flavoprotein
MDYDIAVIGAGASGLVAAISAAREGATVCLIDRNERVGRKILATGNGRCNLANNDMNRKHFHSSAPGFVESVLENVALGGVLSFFASLGLEVASEDSRLYPRSMQAASVLDVLRHEVDRLRIAILTNVRVLSVSRSGGLFRLGLQGQETMVVGQVILATGGKAAPKLGTSGDGYALAAALGHDIVEPIPALVGLRLLSPHLKGLAGLRIQASVGIPELGTQQSGEVLFADYGVSGIPVFDLSAAAAAALRNNRPMHLIISIMPDTPEELHERLEQRFALLRHKTALDVLIGLLPKQLGPALLKDAGFSSLNKSASQVTKQELSSLAGLLHAWSFAILDHNGWVQAQTTAGGVDLKQVFPADMQSKICPGLYFSGEILDVHGDCGGYNLMWAWSSGILAGRSAAFRG